MTSLLLWMERLRISTSKLWYAVGNTFSFFLDVLFNLCFDCFGLKDVTCEDENFQNIVQSVVRRLHSALTPIRVGD